VFDTFNHKCRRALITYRAQKTWERGRGDHTLTGEKMMPNPRDKYRVFQEE